MKKRYELSDGGVIFAADAHEFVTALRDVSWFDSAGTNAQYMRRFAKRSAVYDGNRPCTASEEEFLEDLVKTGYAVPK